MFKILLIHELQHHLFSMRFHIAMAITIITFLTGSIAYQAEYRENKASIDKYRMTRRESVKNMANRNASELATRRQSYIMEPRDNAFLSDCRDSYFPNEFIFSAYNVFSFNVTKNNVNPFLTTYQATNWSFIVTIILSFLALILSYDSISREKENHTLALCLSNPVSRPLLTLSKIMGVIIIIMALLLTGVLLSLILLSLTGVPVNISTIIECIFFLVASLLFIGSMTSIGVLSSVVTKNANKSLLIALSCWIIFILVIPNMAMFWAGKVFPIEHAEAVHERIRAERSSIEAGYPAGKWSSSDNPFMPEHEIRANMQMDFMLNEKKYMDDYYQKMFRQYEHTRYTVFISPVEIMHLVEERLLNGGYERFLHTWESLHNYQPLFLEAFKKFDQQDDNSPHWYNPYESYSTSKKPIPVDKIPEFQYSDMAMSKKITQSVPGILVFIGYIFIALVMTHVIFRKYDVR